MFSQSLCMSLTEHWESPSLTSWSSRRVSPVEAPCSQDSAYCTTDTNPCGMNKANTHESAQANFKQGECVWSFPFSGFARVPVLPDTFSGWTSHTITVLIHFLSISILQSLILSLFPKLLGLFLLIVCFTSSLNCWVQHDRDCLLFSVFISTK